MPTTLLNAKRNASPMRTLLRPLRTMITVMTVMTGVVLSAAGAPSAIAGSLFGDTPCERWTSMDVESRQRWTLAFLAPLSMAHEDRQKTGEDKFNSKAEAAGRAMTSIDTYCTANPGKGAADGAAAHLESLVGTH